MIQSFLFVQLLLALSASTGEAAFQAALEAVAAGNDTAALEQFEAALTADPDNLRYGSEYRQVVIRLKTYGRSLDFFDQLVTSHPKAANAHLNYGFAYVDKIPDLGAITQVINANTALSHFTRSLELQPSWIGYYTRGNSYLYWPKIFNRTQLGIDDLNQAMQLQKSLEIKSYHVRTYISLGDGYWKIDDLARARAIWEEGLREFPSDSLLKERLSASPEGLDSLIPGSYDPNRRVDTDLKELWTEK